LSTLPNDIENAKYSLKFARLKKLSDDQEVILNALKASSTLMEVNAEDKKIRRNPELEVKDIEGKEETIKKTLYLKVRREMQNVLE